MIHILIWVRMHERMVLNILSVDSRLYRRCNSGLPRSMCRDSMLQARAVFKFVQMPASRLSSGNIKCLVGPRLPFALMPLLTLSVVAWTMKWGHLSVSLGSFIRSMMALCLCTVVGRSSEDCRCSSSLQRDYENNSQLCGLTLVPKTESMGMQSVWPTEWAWDVATCGCSLTCRNAPEASSLKIKNFPGGTWCSWVVHLK